VSYHYSYFVGALLFLAAWLACFVFGRKYRHEIVWGSVVSAPFALTSLLFIPQYWFPPSLFNLDTRFHVGIEDFLWAFAVGGIASAIGELLLKEKLAARRRQRHKRHYLPFAAMVLLFVALQHWRPNKTIYNAIVAMAVGAIIVVILRADLILTMGVGSLNFTLIYFALFLCFLALFPKFIELYYNIPNLSGIYVLKKVPIEELLFAASGGAVWSIAYEYYQGYRFEKG
jgi:hypothetical protein